MVWQKRKTTKAIDTKKNLEYRNSEKEKKQSIFKDNKNGILWTVFIKKEEQL